MRILLGWELGAGMGHLFPHRALLAALAARGHSLFAAVRDVGKAARAFEGLNVALHQAPIQATRPSKPYDPTLTFAHVLHNAGFERAEQIHSRLLVWDELLLSVRPDLVLVDHAPTLLLALWGKDVPRASLGSGFFTPPLVHPLPVYWTLKARGTGGASTSDRPLLERLNRLVEGRGYLPLPGLAHLFHQDVKVLLQTYAEIDHYPSRGKATYLGSPPAVHHGDSPMWPAGKGPKVYAYLKPTRGLPRTIADLAQLRWPALVVGDTIPGFVQEKLTTQTVKFASGHLDLEQVARSCDIVLHNGNHGTASHFLHSGIPCLSLPIFLEQELLAASLERLGAGLSLEPNKGEGAAELLVRLARDGSFRHAAHQFRDRHHSGCDEHVEAILKELNCLAAV